MVFRHLILPLFLIPSTWAQDVPECQFLPSMLTPEVTKMLDGFNLCSFWNRHGMNHRPLLHTKQEGDLTPYWAQEMVGLDLSRSLLTKFGPHYPKQPLSPVNVGIIDEGLDARSIPPERLRSREVGLGLSEEDYQGHGTSVAGLIVGEPPVGGTHKAGLRGRASAYQQANGSGPS